MILMASRCFRGHGDGRYPSHSCVTCSAQRSVRVHKGTYVVSPSYALWRDGEYQFLREQGLTPREIGEKHGIRWESFQRTLWRRVGPKTNW